MVYLDNTKSRWGRRRYLYFLSAPFFEGILFAVLLQLDENNTQNYNFLVFPILSLVYLVEIPFSQRPDRLGYEMTSDYNERTCLIGIFGNGREPGSPWTIVPWFLRVLNAAPGSVFESRVQSAFVTLVHNPVDTLFSVEDTARYFLVRIDASIWANRGKKFL